MPETLEPPKKPAKPFSAALTAALPANAAQEAAAPKPVPEPPPAQPTIPAAKPAPAPAPDADAEILEGKRAPKGEDFKRVKHAATEANKRADELKAAKEAADKELAELRKTPKHNAELIKQIESERDELKADIVNLKIGLKKSKSEQVTEHVMEAFDATAKRLKSVEQQLAILTEPVDSETLRASLEQRIRNWREVLRSKHKEECRFIIGRLMAPITIDVPDYEKDLRELRKLGFKRGDRRGKENITSEDCEWTALIKPEGFSDLFHNRLASPISASWNQMAGWLRAVEGLRRAA